MRSQWFWPCVASFGVLHTSAFAAEGAVDTESFVSANQNIVATNETLLQVLAQTGRLDTFTLFLILILVLCLVSVMVHVFHRDVRITIGTFVLGAVFAAVGAIWTWTATANGPPNISGFLRLGETVHLGPFVVSLDDVDTLKTEVSDETPEPWKWHERFGKLAVDSFFKTGSGRLQQTFVIPATPVFDAWPVPDELDRISKSENAADDWENLMRRLDVKLESVTTRRKTKLRAAFSKWPLAKLTVKLIDNNEPRASGYFPQSEWIHVSDAAGKQYRLVVHTIFNGDRDIGESEACVVKLMASE